MTAPFARVDKLFCTKSSPTFFLLVILLIFNSFRPDRLFSGGSLLLYFPTLLLLILLVFWIRTPQKVLFNQQTKLFFFFILVLLLGTLFARNEAKAFTQLRSMFLYAFLPYLMLIQFVDSIYKVEKYIRLFLYFNTFLVFVGITNKGWVSIPTLADENEFALFTNCLIPIAYFLGEEASVKWKKVLYYAMVMLFIFGTVVSFSRGGLVGLASIGLFLFWRSSQKLSSLFLVGVFISGMLFFGSESYWRDMETILTEGAQEGTGKERMESWKAGWNMFLDHPLIGVGPMNYGVWLHEYYSEYGGKEAQVMWGRVAHSVYFTLLPETGLAGTLLFAMMLWRNYQDHRYMANLENTKSQLLTQATLTKEEIELFSIVMRRLYYLSLGYSGATIAFLTTGAFISVLWYDYFWMFTSFWVMSVNVAKKMESTLLEVSSSGGLTQGIMLCPNAHRRSR